MDIDQGSVAPAGLAVAPGPAAARAAPGAAAAAGGSRFAPLQAAATPAGHEEVRSIRVPAHRVTPLKTNWEEIMKIITENLKLMIRYDAKRKCVLLKASKSAEASALQKGHDFVKAFVAGFDIRDAIVLVRMDGMYVEDFDVTDVKNLKGDHLSRGIGRIAGHEGRMKLAIENATTTRIVLAGTKVYILGAHGNIQVARDSICSLILGSPPGKVYAHLRTVAARMAQRY